MKDYLKMYGNKSVAKFQQGGAPVDPNMAPPAPEGGGGGELEQALMQVVQSQDPAMALEFCNMLAEQLGLAGGAPAPGPEGGAPAAVPMARNGMRLQPRFKANGAL